MPVEHRFGSGVRFCSHTFQIVFAIFSQWIIYVHKVFVLPRVQLQFSPWIFCVGLWVSESKKEDAKYKTHARTHTFTLFYTVYTTMRFNYYVTIILSTTLQDDGFHLSFPMTSSNSLPQHLHYDLTIYQINLLFCSIFVLLLFVVIVIFFIEIMM